ncbi:MAG: hypothetical protein ACI8Y4_003419 [Candidatus Poriferisodalaceae bacterium]|jgi:hypothetical protein
MSDTCRHCDFPARWQGLCFTCFERSGAATGLRLEREAREAAEREIEAERREVETTGMLLRLGGEDHEWWEISERLNARGFRYRGRPWSADIARNVYLTLTADDWES